MASYRTAFKIKRQRQTRSASTKPAAAELAHPSVLVADDDIPLRRVVREALEAHDFVVVAEASDAAAAIGAATRLQPDICMIEIELPLEGLNAIGRIAKASPNTLIVVLSRSDGPEDVVTAITRDPSGYPPAGDQRRLARLGAPRRVSRRASGVAGARPPPRPPRSAAARSAG